MTDSQPQPETAEPEKGANSAPIPPQEQAAAGKDCATNISVPLASEHDPGDPGREAAKYRVRVRALETENTSLAAQVAALQRAQIAAQAADAGLRADAIWLTAELETMLSDSGAVDTDKVAAAIKFARNSLGIEVHGGLRGIPEGGNPSSRGGDAFTNAFRKTP